MKKQAIILILVFIVFVAGCRKKDPAETTTTTTAEEKIPSSTEEYGVDEDEVISSAGNDMTCEEWLFSTSNYGMECGRVIQGEPKDLMRMLDQIIQANRDGDAETVDRLTARVRGTASAFREIVPPEELKKTHEKFIRYLGYVEKAVDAELAREDKMRTLYMRASWLNLLDYVGELRTVLVKQRCSETEIKAMERDIVPFIKRKLESLEVD